MATQRSPQRFSALQKSRKFRDRARQESRRLHLEQLEDRRVMAVFVLPNNGVLLNNGETRTVAPKDLTFRFTDIPGLDPTTVSGGFKLERAGQDGLFGQSNDVVVAPGFIGLGNTNREVVMRFAETLPDDTYRITIFGAGTTPLRDTTGAAFNNGSNFTLNFRLDLGAQVVAVVPQPIRRLPNGTLSMTESVTGNPNRSTQNMIHVYFNNDDLDVASATRPEFYRLYVTRNTLDPADDAEITPTSVEYDPVANLARLIFSQASSLDQLAAPDGSPDPIKSFRLRIGTDEVRRNLTTVTRLERQDPGSSFALARDLASSITAGSQGASVAFAQAVEAQKYDLVWPGSNVEPGHRDIPAETHLNGVADNNLGIPTLFYNFRDVIGTIPDGAGGEQLAFNLITELQKQRTREIFELYSKYAGVQFVETEDSGFIVATGDMRVVDPGIPTGPGVVIGIAGANAAGQPVAIMDNAEPWIDQYGEDWFQTAMHEIGHLLGQGHTFDLPPLTIQGDDTGLLFNSPAAEPVFPGDQDIVHMRHQYRPESKDIDMYRFVLDGTGVFTVESFAERLPNSSLLDTALRLYQVNAVTGVIEEIARNDDYFSKDSLIQLNLGPGTYFVGISAAGNDQYDPSIVDSGIGGTTQGLYEIKFDFRKSASQSIVDSITPTNPAPVPPPVIADTLNVAFDGNADGIPGGVYNFWFRSVPLNPDPLDAKRARTIFVDKIAGSGGNGLISAPFNNIPAALAAADPFDIVRIVGNGGADGNLASLADNRAYQIGFNDFSQQLADGPELAVPKDVTVMIDAGAIFQMRRSQLSVGSTSPSIASDRSGGALQVLGTPTTSVYFTSYNEVGPDSVGLDQNPLNIPPAEGNWGGLSFRNDLDRADGRFDHEAVGVFLNYVNHADMRFGGGQVNVNSLFEVVTPINMVDRRPTATFNTITRSADAAMSANPDSFEETNFQAPRFWPTFSSPAAYNPSGIPGLPGAAASSTSYTLDYDRIGPDIHGNLLLNNTTNGLFVRTRTPAGNVLEELTVAGRFDDTDIVHVIQENLVVRGTPGGTTLEQTPPPIDLIVFTQVAGVPDAGPGFAVGTNLEYKLVYIDLLGNEGLVSETFTLPGAILVGGSDVLLTQLPDPAVPNPQFVARRLYRRTSPIGPFVLVDQIPASVTQYTDRNIPISGATQVLKVLASNPTALVPVTIQRARLDASLVIDPSIVVKSDGARFDVDFGGNLLAEGAPGQEIVFTSIADDRYGAGGTFDNNNDNRIVAGTTPLITTQTQGGVGVNEVQTVTLSGVPTSGAFSLTFSGQRTQPVPFNVTAAGLQASLEALSNIVPGDVAVTFATGIWTVTFQGAYAAVDVPQMTGVAEPVGDLPGAGDWGGIFFGPDSKGSIDDAVFAYAGGLTRVEGTFAGFNVVEIHQAEVRIAQSKFEFNQDGQGGQAPADRFGRGFNRPGTVFIRGAQPVIFDSTVIENFGPFANINVNALTHDTVVDKGRQTELIEREAGHLDNNGPLLFRNRLRGNQFNGMIVRGGTLTTESVWDDTDIAHILLDAVTVPDFHAFGGLRLESTATESLVVKAFGASAGITATGRPLEIDDRIGGIVQILGQPGFPVVLTSILDDTEGAGFTPEGVPQTDTNGDGTAGQTGTGQPTFPPATGPFTVTTNNNAAQLVSGMTFRTLPAGVTISNETFVGAATSAGTYINGDSVALQVLPRGIILSSGNAQIPASNTSTIFTGINNTPGDADLSALIGGTATFDAAVLTLTIDIAPNSGIKSGLFDFQFGSEEFPEFVGSPFNDVLGGFINGGAVTNFIKDSQGNLVSINSGFFNIDNRTGALNIEYDGLTSGLTAAFPLQIGTNVLKIAISDAVDPVGDSGIVLTDLRFSTQSVTGGVSGLAGPGDWQGITIDQFAHDRNVETILEQEAAIGDGSANEIPQKAQFIGALGPFEKGGDENLRLGLTVHGLLNNINDIDVFSFAGKTGTEVWIDIDRSTHALDAIIELIDTGGNVLARSNNSVNEGLPLDHELHEDRVGLALGMHKVAPFQGRDFYTTNQRDPALRVLLPGPANTTNTYFVRVRSSAGSSITHVIDGATGLVTELVQGGTNHATEIMIAGGPTFATAIQGNSGAVTELVKGTPAVAAEIMRGGGPGITTTTQGGLAVNEVQRIAFAPVPTGGTFTLSFDGDTTGPIPFDAIGSVVQGALEALAGIGGGSVSVAAGPPGIWDVTFQGALANTNVSQLTGASNEIQRVTAPGGLPFTLTFDGQTTAPIPGDATASQVQSALEGLSNITSGDVIVSGAPSGPWDVEFAGVYVNQNTLTMSISEREIQRVALAGIPTGGTFTLVYLGTPTAPIAFNASGPTVQAALEVNPLLIGHVVVTAVAGGTWDLAFQGVPGGPDVALLEVRVNEVQTFSLPGNPTGGTFTLSFGGVPTLPIAFNATAADVQTALQIIPALTLKVQVTKVLNTWSVEFIGPLGNLANTDVAALTGAMNEFQRVTSPVPGGALTLSFNGQVTSLIPPNAIAADVQSALAALSNIGLGNVAVTGPVGGPYDVEFRGALAGASQNEIVILTAQVMQANSPSIATTQQGGGGLSEVQTVTLLASPVGGTFRLTFSGQQTGPIAFNATTVAVRTALEALANIAVGDVAVAGVPGAWIVQFTGALANLNVAQMTGSSNEFQRVLAPAGGGFSLVFNGQGTAPIPSNATAAQVQAALVALGTIGAGNVAVTGNAGGPWDVEFRGAFAGINVPAMAIGQDEVQRITLPVDPDGTTFTLTFQGQTTAPLAFNATADDVKAALEALSNIAVGDVAVSGNAGGPWDVRFTGTLKQTDVSLLSATVNEVQRVALLGSPTAGTFTLTFDGQTTAPLAFNATADDVKAALEALSNIAVGDVAVSGNAGGPWDVEFKGAFLNLDIPDLILDDDHLIGGLTSGAFQLQLRLREVDELGGTTVRFAKIANAVNGIRVLGGPSHSPLGGETSEANNATNNTLAGAQFIGNLLNSDRSALTIAGSMSAIGDVDWYRMDINYDATEGIPGVSTLEDWWSTIFDIDYADGLARPNLMVHVFDTAGNLLLSSRDSNVAEDRPNPSDGSGVSDLSRGSVGTTDPWIGPAEMPQGTYLIAVSNEGNIPAVLNQFFTAAAVNPLIRLEPINSVQRIVEDHISFDGGSTGSSPLVLDFINTVTTSPQTSIVPWNLHDVTLFVSQDRSFQGVPNNTRIFTVDPFSGLVETTVGEFGDNIGDLAMHPAGRLHTYTVFQELQQPPSFGARDAYVGNYLQINTGNGSVTRLQDDTIETYDSDGAAPPAAVRANLQPDGSRVGEGVHFRGITIANFVGNPFNNGIMGLAVGGRDVLTLPGPPLSHNGANILYAFDPDTGLALPQPPNVRTGVGLIPSGVNGFPAGTQIVEQGVLDTTIDAIPSGPPNAIIAAEATFVDPITGATTFRIMDNYAAPQPPEIPPGPEPTTFTISGTTFEFDAGPEALFNIAPTLADSLRDGNEFFVNATRMEFDTGPVVNVLGTGNLTNFPGGSSLSVTDVNPGGAASRPPRTIVFEFTNTGNTTIPNAIPILVSGNPSNQAMADRIVTAINTQQNPGDPTQWTTQAVRLPGTGRVSLTNVTTVPSINPEDDSDGFLTGVALTGATIFGALGVDPADVQIRIEETSVQANLNGAFARSNVEPNMPFNTQVGVSGPIGAPNRVTAGFDGNRLNYSGASTIANNTVPANIFRAVGSLGGVTAGRTPVPFLAQDSQGQIASRMATAIGGAAIATPTAVIIPGSVVTAATPPLQFAGQGLPGGGVITGLTTITQPVNDDPTDTVVWAVTSNGGLFRIVPGTAFAGPALDFIGTATALSGINFSGLANGPIAVEGDIYRNLLFGITGAGVIHAFDTQGVLQRVFVSQFDAGTAQMRATSNIPTGITSANGLAFSPLTVNPWRNSTPPERSGDPGHGIEPIFDRSRPPTRTPGGTSLRFQSAGTGNGNYDSPGDSHGSIESRAFSLKGFSAADKPTLYYNYFLETENAEHNPPPPVFMRDSFRAFISGDDGVWHLLSTNDSAVIPGGSPLAPNDDFDYAPVRVQETWDNTGGWRQVRIPLGDFAGQENLQIRFDFASAGSMNIGTYRNLTGAFNTQTNGDELRAVEGIYLRDGQRFTLTASGTSNQTFEFNMGFTLEAPNGSVIPDGATFTIDGVGFEFDNQNLPTPGFFPVRYQLTDTPAQIAQKIAVAIDLSPIALAPPSAYSHVHNNRVNLRRGIPGGVVGATSVTATGMPASFIEGSTTVLAGNVPINVHSGMTRLEVREAIALTLAATYAEGVRPRIKTHGEFVRLLGEVNPITGVPLSGYRWIGQIAGPNADPVNQKLLGITTSLPGDIFGGFNSNLRGQNNQFEALYVDDIIIGFAERGEMTTGVATNSNFVTNPQTGGNVTVGAYQLEMRRAAEAGVPNPFPPPDLALLASIDTNERQMETRTLFTTPGADINDGQFFSLSDGINTLHFEFNDLTIAGSGVVPGRVRIDYRPDDTDALLARRVRDVVNSGQVQAVIKVTAQLGDGSVAAAASSSNQINFIGPISFPNTGAGSSQLPALPLVAEANNGTLIDNDTLVTTAGHFEVRPASGGSISTGLPVSESGATVQVHAPGFPNQLFQNETLIFDLLNFIDVGSDGGAIDLSATTITQLPTLIGEDLVESRGEFLGANGLIQWTAVTQIGDGSRVISNTLTFTSAVPLGSLRYINYMDDDIFPPPFTDDLLFATGTPGEASFKLFQLDNATRVGLAQYGVYDAGPGLVGATYDGWGAAPFPVLGNAIVGPGLTYTEEGNIGLPSFFDDRLGLVYGLNDISSAMAWSVDPDATSATITTFLELQEVDLASPLAFRTHTEEYGDQNRFRDQGQIILHGNEIKFSSQWGILIDAAARTAVDGNSTHNGPPRTLRELNFERLLPGVVVTNNVIHNNTLGGVRFSGDSANVGATDAPVPFGRIVNNTFFGLGGTLTNGSQTDIGIRVDETAGPTLLNNIVANFNIGVSVDASSQGSTRTVLGGMLFQGNDTNSNVGLGGDFPIVLNNNQPLFVNAGAQNFYLKALSPAIDSSVDSLLDRPSLVTVRNPLGILPSPIVSPDRDGVGQLRVDDPSVSTPQGFGLNPFKDRGAIDRVDFTGPTGVLINPPDNDAAGTDLDPSPTVVVRSNDIIRNFQIRLFDRFDPSGPPEGSDIDDFTVTSAKVKIEVINGATPVLLVEDVDYAFSYDRTNNVITLTPLGGLWPLSRTYRITLDNTLASGIADKAGNILLANQIDGSHIYTIFIGSAIDWGDAPNTYGTTAASGGPNHQTVPGIRLGASVGAESDGQPSAGANLDPSDDGVSNFILSRGGLSSFTVVASTAGKIDAWLDLDKDGVFDLPGEYIVAGFTVTTPNVSTAVPFTLPDGPQGNTILRVRFSTAGIATPGGFAADGEVEDYLVTMVGPAFHNGVQAADVNNDGVVNTIDLLIEVNFITFLSGELLPGFGVMTLPITSPPYKPTTPTFDPTGGGIPGQGKFVDVAPNALGEFGTLDTLDLLAIITYLTNNFVPGGGGEGEGEGWAPAALASGSSQASGGSNSPASAMFASAALFASPNIVVEVRESNSSPTGDDDSWLSTSDDHMLDLLASAQQVDHRSLGRALSLEEHSRRRVPIGPLDEDAWDSLLADLSLDVGGLPAGPEDQT